MTKGIVKLFNLVKGYGFIEPEAGDRDVFVHALAVHKSGMRALNEGQIVRFEVETCDGRSAAVNL